MNREELAQMYEKANGWNPAAYTITMEELERFAALVASAEREAILAVIGDNQCECRCSEVVRDRGQA